MEEALYNAFEELKRVDHLIYVSLKYTRTCDIFKSIIERLVNAIDYGLDALLKKLEQDKKIYEIPDQPGMKCSVIRQHIDDPDLHKIIDFYLLLRQMNRAEFARAREFRRHVTMTLVIQGEKVEVNIDNITEFYKQTKDHLAYMRKLTIGT
ncbi:TPA: hypothetical protein HA249_07195 [Candidatus Woesearchaeota archaeon]|nr:hypothetical protein [Candidatus Woesearchaeota archaeon]HIH47145.1 hypothetical protein [Candidatus Woesearchaeota archaeon]